MTAKITLIWRKSLRILTVYLLLIVYRFIQDAIRVIRVLFFFAHLRADLMPTRVISTTHVDALTLAAALLDAQNVIAAPTDTVYGLVCAYDSVAAIDALYEAKGRPPEKALPILLAGEDQLDQVVAEVSALARGLMERFWPGPLTLVLPGLPHLPARLTAGMDSVAVRVPDHPVLRALAQASGPLASSSANRSGGPDTASAQAVLAQLDGLVPLILDGGTAPGGIPSTVLDFDRNRPGHPAGRADWGPGAGLFERTTRPMSRPLLIGIDASRALRARRTGTERYSLEIIQHLLALPQAAQHTWRLYADSPPPPGLFPTRTPGAARENVEIQVLARPPVVDPLGPTPSAIRHPPPGRLCPCPRAALANLGSAAQRCHHP